LFRLLTKENENLILYKKINVDFILKDKNYLYLGSYLISVEISFESTNQRMDNEKDALKNKNLIRSKIKHLRTNFSEIKELLSLL